MLKWAVAGRNVCRLLFTSNSKAALSKTLQHTATHCSTLQHTAAHCNTLQHTATHCNSAGGWGMDSSLAALSQPLQHPTTHCNTLQHTATHCNTLQHTASQLVVGGLCQLLFTSNPKAMDSSLAALSNLSLDARQTDLILKHLNMVSLSLQCVPVRVAVCCNMLQRA